MANAYQVQVVTSLLDGSSTERTTTKTASGSLSEDFWIKVNLASGASETEIALGLLTDPKILVVEGGEGIWLETVQGGNKIYADPVAVLSNEEDGLNISSVFFGNDSASQKTVVIIAVE